MKTPTHRSRDAKLEKEDCSCQTAWLFDILVEIVDYIEHLSSFF